MRARSTASRGLRSHARRCAAPVAPKGYLDAALAAIPTLYHEEGAAEAAHKKFSLSLSLNSSEQRACRQRQQPPRYRRRQDTWRRPQYGTRMLASHDDSI